MGRLTNRILARIYTAFPHLAAAWGKKLAADGSPIPWTVPRTPLREAVVALVTTGGVHLLTQPPFDMADKQGDASWREIPTEAPREQLTITHDYYDHRDAEADLNLVFPTQRLKEFVTAGALKELHSPAYSLMGHIDGDQLRRLRGETAPALARRLAAAGVDYALLVPA